MKCLATDLPDQPCCLLGAVDRSRPRIHAAYCPTRRSSKWRPRCPRKRRPRAQASRKLLIYDGNVGYGGHGSIPYANHAFTRMGEKTGAFTTEVSDDPAVFQKEHLSQFDAVCLNNTVGNLFTDPVLRQNLLEFVLAGGGLLGIHGTTVAFTDFANGAQETWPEFGNMLGGRGAAHLAQDEHVFVKLDAPDHPLNRPFGGQGFEHVSEFFRVGGPYSRDRVHVLLSIDTRQDRNCRPRAHIPAWNGRRRLRPGLDSQLRSRSRRLLHDRPQSAGLHGPQDPGVLSRRHSIRDGRHRRFDHAQQSADARRARARKNRLAIRSCHVGPAHVHAVGRRRKDAAAGPVLRVRTEFPEGERGHPAEFRLQI